MKVRTLLTVAALLLAVGLGGWMVLRLLEDPTLWRPDDYVEYWAAGRLNLHGQNPYSAELLLPVEYDAGRIDFPKRVVDGVEVDDAVMMWNPPWTLSVAMPLGALPARVGQLLWMLLNAGSIAAAAVLLWKAFAGNADKVWIGVAVAFTFVPTLFLLQAGQIGGLLLLGCALFAWCAKRGYHVPAGAAAVLIAIKPHLVYLLAPAVLLDAVTNKRWRILLGGVAVLVVASLIPTAVNPAVWSQYVAAYKENGPSQWLSLTIGAVLRLLFGQEKFWLQFLPMLPGAAWLGWQWWRAGKTWDWAEQMPAVVLVSFVTAPYGAWHFDLVLLIVPLVHRAAAYVNDPRGWIVPVAVLALMNVAMVVLAKCNLSSFWYVWVAPAVLVGYVLTARRVPALAPPSATFAAPVPA